MIFKMTIRRAVLFLSIQKFPVIKRKITADVSSKPFHSPSGAGNLRKEFVGNGYYLYGNVVFLQFLIIYFYSNVSKEDSD